MIYVMSDLHGEYEKFLDMLELIDFSKEDTLYILGDVLDRGNEPLKIIDYIRKPENDNIHLLLGNHELLFMSYYLDKENLIPWFSNGGFSTLSKLNERETKYIDELYNYLSTRPLYKIIDKFILVHAGIFLPNNKDELSLEELMKLQTQDTLLWDREFVYSNNYFKDFTVICGHTPTFNLNEFKDKSKILYSQGKVMIDCGACFEKFNGRLACLRLDDLEEFYID